MSYVNRQPTCDRLMDVEVMFQSNILLENTNIVGISITLEGVLIRSHDENIKLNSIIYDVELTDVRVKEHAANVMTDIMLTRVESE